MHMRVLLQVEPKHLAGPFFSEGSYTKNTVDEVDEMMARLDACARGKVDGAIDDAEVAGAVARKTPLRERADPISIERFMGKWYVNAAIPTLFDRGVVNSTEEYTWNAAKKRIDVSFKMQASLAAPVKEILQRASIVNGEASPGAPDGVNTRWALSPAVGGLFLPLGLAYLVVDCAEDYSSTIIGVPNRSALYVMTRTPTPSDAVLERLLDTCRRTGHDMSKVVRVQHGASSQPAAGALPGGDNTESASAAAAEPAPAGIPVPRALLGRPFDGPARLCMATMTPSHNSSNAKRLMDIISEESLAAAASSSSSSSPPKYATWFATFPRGSSSPYYAWVEDLKKELPDEQRATYSSRVGWSAPFVWVERPDGTRTAIGGRDALCEWASREFADCPAIVKAASASLRYVDAFSYSSKPGTAAAPVYLTAPEVTLTPPAGEKM